MKKYLLFLTSLGLLIIFGLASFVKAVKSDTETVKKVIQKVNPIPTSLNRQLLASEFEKDRSPQASEKLDQASKEEILQNISELPLTFQKNMGQWQAEVLYRTACPTAKVSFTKKGLSFFSIRELEEHDEDDAEEEDNAGEEEEVYEKMVWNLNFKGMNSQTEIVAEGEVAGVTNYLLGNDSTKWIMKAPESRLINYKEIYDHIDLHYYGLANNKLKYDYILKPGANITSIQMELDGAGGLTINNNGELVIETPWGKVAEDKPYSYQIINGVKKEIDIRYHILDDKTFGFAAYGQYDKNYDLVIDPKTLVWSTYAKGMNSTFYVQDIGIDANRNSYITGWSDGNIPITSSVAQGTFGGSEDAFVCKFNRFGTTLVYSTYIGGSNAERAYAIAVSSGGNAYVTGRTDSNSDFPTTAGAAFTTSPGSTDIFISAFNSTGGFIYSTYYGGGSSDEGKGIFVNASNEVYITGKGQKSSSPTLFPTTAGVVYPNGSTSGIDAFVAKLTAGGAIVFSTMLGGSSEDLGYGIYVPTTGEIYVTGYTKGNFAAPNATPTYGAFNSGQDAFVAKLNATATSLTYLAYLSGGANDVGYGVHVRNGEAYVSGTTTSTNFPTTAGVFQTANAGGTDLFVTKLNTTGTALVYSTYLGGSANESVDDDRVSDIFVNNNGEAYVSNTTTSVDYPTVPPAASGYHPARFAPTGEDGAISLVSNDGKKLLCSTYFGGNQNDYKRLAIVVDITNALQDTLYASVTSHSADIPIVQTQGAVYGPTKVNGTDDQPVIWKMISCMVPLPVELMSFTGANKGDHNLLEWTTATEKNNDYFTVERSSDGINFLTVGTVDGSGNSSSILNYSYSDPKDGEEITYYRLKQTDFNGQISYSDVITINAADPNRALELTIFSPVTDHLNYKVCCVHKGNAQVEVIDMAGRVVISSTVHVNEGYNKLRLDSKILADGLYILKFTADNGSAKAKFVK